MKKLLLCLQIIFSLSSLTVYCQVEVRGSGNTSVTKTWIATNSNPDTTMVILDDGKVGIGVTNPTEKFEVNGIIYSKNGGIKFPDGTTQTTASVGGVNYQNVFTVSPSGGDFASISAAIAACNSPGPNNTYLIRVMPGIYNEAGGVVCPQYVHLKGAGKYTTVIAGGSVTCGDNNVIEGFKIEKGVVCQGTSTIIHNIITNPDNLGDGIVINVGSNTSSEPWIIENEIVDCGGWGISVSNHGCNPWIFGNKIYGNNSGGIFTLDASPTISNNILLYNNNFGIKLTGYIPDTIYPTITDNVIDKVSYQNAGKGIEITSNINASIIGNNIHHCEWGIWISDTAQPSIISNNISYNFEAGIVCNNSISYGMVVIKSNHIHHNVNQNAISHRSGIYINSSTLIIVTHNNIINNNPGNDINYQTSPIPPMISLNVFDNILKNSTIPASGLYNVTSLGGSITP